MEDAFGTDGVMTEGMGTSDPAVAAMAQGTGGMTATAPVPAPVPVAAAPAAAAQPTLQQTINKATAKAEADAKVGTDPNALHHVKLAPLAPINIGAAAAGAMIGSALFPGPGTLVGALAGYVSERWQIGGGPVGRAWGWTKGKLPVIQKGEDALKGGLKKATGG